MISVQMTMMVITINIYFNVLFLDNDSDNASSQPSSDKDTGSSKPPSLTSSTGSLKAFEVPKPAPARNIYTSYHI